MDQNNNQNNQVYQQGQQAYSQGQQPYNQAQNAYQQGQANYQDPQNNYGYNNYPQNTGYNQPYMQQQLPVSGMAIASMVMGILSILLCWVPSAGFGHIISYIIALAVPTIGIILSVIGLNQTKEGAGYSGRGMAIAGLVCSIIGIIIVVINIIVIESTKSQVRSGLNFLDDFKKFNY